LDFDPVLFTVRQDIKIEIMEQCVKGVENLLSGVEHDPAAGDYVMEFGKMVHDQKKTNGGQKTDSLLQAYSGIKSHDPDLLTCRRIKADG